MDYPIPDTCAYCGESPVYESTWEENDGTAHSVWLCLNCDTKRLADLVDFWMPAKIGGGGGHGAAPKVAADPE